MGKKEIDEKNNGPWACKSSSDIKDKEKILIKVSEYPFKQRPFVSMGVVFFIVVISFLSYFIVKHYLTPAFVFMFLIISNTSFFLPSHYTITEDKIVVDRIIYKQGYPWARFRSFVVDKNGVFLTPSKDPNKFDRFRGVFILMGPENIKKIKPILEEKVSGSH